jgi:integrase
LGLEWRDVRWAKDGPHFGELELRPELDKVGKGYKVPMSRTAHDLLARRFVHRNADLTLILVGYQGKPTNLRATYKAIIAACHRADLPRPLLPNHHMRRSFGRWAVMGHLTGRPVPLYVVSKWMGHASVKMTEDYLDVHTDESQQWMAEFAPTSERHEGDPGLRKDSGGQ